MTNDSATIDATRWFSGSTLEKKAAVYHLLINEKMIAARIADILDKNKATISRWINRLVREQYIIESTAFIDHQKEMEQVRKGSVSLTFKAYKSGARAEEMNETIHKLQSQMGVHRDTPIWSPLPGGVEPRIDIHRIDYNIPANTNGPRGGMPHDRDTESWARMGVVPSGNEIRGWIHFAAPDIESAIGPWRVRFRRRMSRDDEGNPVYGGFCTPHPVRLTMPSRYIITPKEAMDESAIRMRIGSALYHVMAELSKLYGFTLALPKAKNSQEFEAGTLRYDPALAKEIRERRKRGEPRMLPMNEDGSITADGSHGLLKDDIVHLDGPPEKIAAQAAPVLFIDTITTKLSDMAENTAKVANESIETIEENSVNTTTRIADNMQGELFNLVERMNNTFEEMLQREEARRVTEEERRNQVWNNAFTEDRESFRERMNRAVARFEQSLRDQGITLEEGQMVLTDFEEA